MTARFGETFAVTVDNMESSIMHRIVARRQAIKNERVAGNALCTYSISVEYMRIYPIFTARNISKQPAAEMNRVCGDYRRRVCMAAMF